MVDNDDANNEVRGGGGVAPTVRIRGDDDHITGADDVDEELERMMMAHQEEEEKEEERRREARGQDGVGGADPVAPPAAAAEGGGVGEENDAVDGGVRDGIGERGGVGAAGEDARAGGGLGAEAAAGGGAGGDVRPPMPPPYVPPRRSYLRVHYSKLSVGAAAALVLFALRTRGQAYLALTYLTSSKLSYIVMGNAVVAAVVSTFHILTGAFLGGLRISETEAIGESIRWNVTETCIALTIFRSEVDVGMGGRFLTMELGKCLHWAAELRGSHLRMTEEAFYFLENDAADPSADPGTHWTWRLANLLLPEFAVRPLRRAYLRSPRVPWSHLKLVGMVELLLLCDVAAVSHCAMALAENGPSVHILFGFEAAILGVSALSCLASYDLHIVDGLITVLHHLADPDYHAGMRLYHGAEEVLDEAEAEEGPPPALTPARRFIDHMSASWRDRRATLSFGIELLTQALKFLFYLLFFAIVFTYYGMPINLFREVYVSYQNLRRRLAAFASYRRLTSNMNERFQSATEEQLEEAGRTCIICRDRMEAGPGGRCKVLPGCGHVFHGHCLREWLVQQQTCPTCRGDIQANEARERADKKRKEEAEKTEREEADKNQTEEAEKKKAEATAAQATATATARAEGQPLAAAASGAQTATETALSAPSAPVEAAGGEGDCSIGQGVFPALYRATSPGGTPVYVRPPAADAGAIPPQVADRTIPVGRLMLCVRMNWWPSVSSGGTAEASDFKGEGMMLRIPDGWVSEGDVERVSPLKGGGGEGSE